MTIFKQKTKFFKSEQSPNTSYSYTEFYNLIHKLQYCTPFIDVSWREAVMKYWGKAEEG